MEQATTKIGVEQIFRNLENKEGRPYLTKAGKPFKVVHIKATDGKSYSAVDFDGWTDPFHPGDTFDAIVEVVEKDGRTFYNLQNPSAKPGLEARVEKLEEMAKVATELSRLQKKQIDELRAALMGKTNDDLDSKMKEDGLPDFKEDNKFPQHYQ